MVYLWVYSSQVYNLSIFGVAIFKTTHFWHLTLKLLESEGAGGKKTVETSWSLVANVVNMDIGGTPSIIHLNRILIYFPYYKLKPSSYWGTHHPWKKTHMKAVEHGTNYRTNHRTCTDMA